MQQKTPHSFHIPVMGIGYTVDTPAKVAQFGISSVISLVDDILMEKMREFYSKKLDLPFQAITNKMEDFRAKRITSYLNLIDKIVKDKFNEVKKSVLDKSDEIEKYIEMLPDFSEVKLKFQEYVNTHTPKNEILQWLHSNLHTGSIDVNIMTKLDKDNYLNNEKLPAEFNDAHAALRGFANSNLNSSIVLSAGMNPRLYSYFEQFEDFYPDVNGFLRKKVILKVSDYRSALIQAKFLAKKGIWISEYRIESGLNCGGHAFASDGFLMGPILEEFKNNRESLVQTVHEILVDALKSKNKPCPEAAMEMKITAQGGVGTAEEHDFLLNYYQLDSIGWATPFLLVPEVVNVDKETLDLLCASTEDDLYTSSISPLGVPFNSLRQNTKDVEKRKLIEMGRPGSSCPKQYVALSKEFTERVICTASRQYQHLKLKELDTLSLSKEDHQIQYDKITEKSCICVGLGTAALINNGLDTKDEGPGVSVCPGPNIAYFDKEMSLHEMADHIYGRKSQMHNSKRPHMFINELKMYLNHLKLKIAETPKPLTGKSKSSLLGFQENLKTGIEYYKNLFSEKHSKLEAMKTNTLKNLENYWKELNTIKEAIE